MECLICAEDIEDSNTLSCGHNIHMKCVANSGKSMCPMCRIDIVIPDEFKCLYDTNIIKNKEHIEHQNLDDAIRIHLLLNNTTEEEDDEYDEEEYEEDEGGRQMFMIGLNSIEYVHKPMDEVTMDVLFEELSKINYATGGEILYTDIRFVDIIRLGYDLKEYCICNDLCFEYEYPIDIFVEYKEMLMNISNLYDIPMRNIVDILGILLNE